MGDASTTFAKQIREQLISLGDPERAAQQQAYMKSEMPFAGVAMPALRKLCRETEKALPMPDQETWLHTADVIWRGAIFREERHAAIELLAIPKRQKAWLEPTSLPQLKFMIRDGAWWDFVDALAINHVGVLLRRYEHDIKPELEQWISDDDLWIRRSAILAQLKFKTETDFDFLDRAIQGSIADNNFFARKGIGWALRELSKTNPDWVIAYVERHKDVLSPLSIREGLKVVNKQGK